MNNEKTYHLTGYNKFLFTFVALLICYVCIIMVGIYIESQIRVNHVFGKKDISNIFQFLLFGLVILPLFINTYSKIKVTKDGINVRFFYIIYFWKFIPWNEMISLELSRIQVIGFKHFWVLRVKKFNIFSRLLAMSFGLGIYPCVSISPDFSDYMELVDILKSRIASNPQELTSLSN